MMMDAPALCSTISSGRSRLRSGMVTDGMISRWGGTTSLLRGMDSRNRLVGDAIVDDPPVSELTTEHDDERFKEPSTDPDDERCEKPLTNSDDERREEPSTDTDAGVTYSVRRRFTKPSRVSDEIGSSRATTLARADEYDWKELCKSRPVVAIETATVGNDGGACSLATSFIFCAMISKPVSAGTPRDGMTPRAESAAATTTGDATTRNVMKNATMKGKMDGGGGCAMKRLEVVEQEGNKLPKPCE